MFWRSIAGIVSAGDMRLMMAGVRFMEASMLHLIISLIAIALVAISAMAAIYYGGGAFTDSTSRLTQSKAAAIGGQISAAAKMYKAFTGSEATGVDDLIASGYLAAAPKRFNDAATGGATVALTATVTRPVGNSGGGEWIYGFPTLYIYPVCGQCSSQTA